jgi:NAD(P)-dependent dehydrogenase (short-subunit alcohol dehydrogenase family)
MTESKKIHIGKVAIVTGAAAGIGKSIAFKLHREGAIVYGIDINPDILKILNSEGLTGLICDIANQEQLGSIVVKILKFHDKLVILVGNAGIFPAGKPIEFLEDDVWEKTLRVNLSSHRSLLKYCIPYLKNGSEPTAIFIGSRNVHAPGAGVSAYSVSKAGLTQLVRVAALELAPFGIRVNIIHPDAVFDTELWTAEKLKSSAERYGLSIEEYQTRNLLKTKIMSDDVANVVSIIASPIFAKTTGAQIPVDGGNERVI